MSRLRASLSPFQVPCLFTALLTLLILFYTAGQRAAILVRMAMLLGAVMAGMVASRWGRTGQRIPQELWILCIFLVWAVGWGYLLAIDSRSFTVGVKQMVQIVMIAGCVACMAAITRTPASGFLAITGLAVVLVGYGLLTGDFASAAELTQRGDRLVAHRATSLASNANTLGVACVWALAGLALLWRRASRFWQQGLLAILTLPLFAGMVFSGSRKAVLLAPIFLLAWVWFCYRRVLFHRAPVFVAVGIGAAACVAGGAFVLRGTFVGIRLQSAFSSEERDGSAEVRLSLMKEGIRMITEHPITGVGLFQFPANNHFGAYAHNDYIEVAATTGLVGFLIYYSIFALVAWRLVRVHGRCEHPETRYVAGVCLATLVTCAAAGLVLVMVSSVAFWCFISGVVGFASAAERTLPRSLLRLRRPQLLPPRSQQPNPVAAVRITRR